MMIKFGMKRSSSDLKLLDEKKGKGQSNRMNLRVQIFVRVVTSDDLEVVGENQNRLWKEEKRDRIYKDSKNQISEDKLLE